MKTTNIPAQVINIEDHITHNLSLNQLIILIIPLILSFIIYLIFPPFNSIDVYKIILMVVLISLISTLAIRLNNKLILNWLIVIILYLLRPRYYVFNKNQYKKLSSNYNLQDCKKPKKNNRTKINKPKINKFQTISIDNLTAQKSSNFSFKITKQGKIYVRFFKK